MSAQRLILAVICICAIAVGACRAEPAVDSLPGEPVSADAESLNRQLSATLAVIAAEPTLKYPKATWVVELKLANGSSAPAWFLIPEPPEYSPDLERGAWAVEAVRLGGLRQQRWCASQRPTDWRHFTSPRERV